MLISAVIWPTEFFPIAFDEALEMGIIGNGSTVTVLGFGAGVTWGAVISKLEGGEELKNEN